MDIIRLFSDGFPLTIERLQFLQTTYVKAFSQLSTIAGTGNVIINGVDVAGANVSAGVIIRDGEVLEFEGGAFNARVAIFETVNDVPYNIDDDGDGILDLKVADVVRTAKCAATGGVDAFNFDTLKRVSSLVDLMPKIGDVKLITRDFDPLVDIGWELLDMSDIFPMGAGGTNAVNTEGGANSVTLSENQMPIHKHSASISTSGEHTHSVPAESPLTGTGVHFRIENNARRRQQGEPAGAHTHTATIGDKGGDQPHENRPKFRAFNFLRFIGI